MTKDQAIARARELYADGSNDDIEIDEHPDVEITQDGTWVQAWVWVPHDDKDEDLT
jgi:hypothetical protein